MARLPKVSVIIPAYQAEETIERAIRSVLRQTCGDLEILVVDNASLDKTRQKVVYLSSQDARAISIHSAKNLGPAGGRNLAIARAKGDFIAFLDADDEWVKETKLAEQVEILNQHRNVGVVFTECSTYDELTGTERLYSTFNNLYSRALNFTPLGDAQKFQMVDGTLDRSLYSGNFICISTVLVRKSLLEEINLFNPILFGTEDIDLWVRLAKICQFCYWNEATTRYFWQENSISRISHNRIKELIKYHLYCRTAPAYDSMQELVSRNLEHCYKLQILEYSRRWQTFKAFQSFYEAKKQDVDSIRLFWYALASLLGPIPLIIKLKLVNRVISRSI